MESFKKVVYHMFVLLKRNPGAIFVVLFMITLAGAAGFLMDKKEQIAIHIANLAYLFLVVGTVIYMIQLYIEKRRDDKQKKSTG